MRKVIASGAIIPALVIGFMTTNVFAAPQIPEECIDPRTGEFVRLTPENYDVCFPVIGDNPQGPSAAFGGPDTARGPNPGPDPGPDPDPNPDPSFRPNSIGQSWQRARRAALGAMSKSEMPAKIPAERVLVTRIAAKAMSQVVEARLEPIL